LHLVSFVRLCALCERLRHLSCTSAFDYMSVTMVHLRAESSEEIDCANSFWCTQMLQKRAILCATGACQMRRMICMAHRISGHDEEDVSMERAKRKVESLRRRHWWNALCNSACKQG